MAFLSFSLYFRLLSLPHTFTFIYFLTHSVSDPCLNGLYFFFFIQSLFYSCIPPFHSCLFFTFSLQLFLLLYISISLSSFEVNIKSVIFYFIVVFLYLSFSIYFSLLLFNFHFHCFVIYIIF